jgi:hypothetical protein
MATIRRSLVRPGRADRLPSRFETEGFAVVRTFLAAGNMITAFILAILAIIFLGLNYPSAISTSLRWARSAKDVITGTGLNPSYNVWLEFLLEDRQLVFIGFTIIMRMLLALVTYTGMRIRDRVRGYD